MKNIDQFNFYVGCIFATLYESFPCRTQIDFYEIIGCEMVPESTDETGARTGLYLKDGKIQQLNEEFDFLYETLSWLYQTGYLLGNVGISSFGRGATVTLSPKTLELLNISITSIDKKLAAKSIGDELSDAVNTAAKEKVIELTKNSLSYLFKRGWMEALASQPFT